MSNSFPLFFPYAKLAHLVVLITLQFCPSDGCGLGHPKGEKKTGVAGFYTSYNNNSHFARMLFHKFIFINMTENVASSNTA